MDKMNDMLSPLFDRNFYLPFLLVFFFGHCAIAQVGDPGKGVQIINDTGPFRLDVYRPGIAQAGTRPVGVGPAGVGLTGVGLAGAGQAGPGSARARRATAGLKKRPAVIFVHGGGFIEGDKRSGLYVTMATAFAMRGYVCFSVNYRLKPKDIPYSRDILDGCISDVMAAVRWITRYSALYDVDTTELFICGDSAGGGIVVNISYDPVFAKYFIGCIDLWGGLPGKNGWDAPIFAGDITSHTPPTCMIHGTKDRIVPFATSEVLGERLTGAGVYHELHRLDNADHYPVDLADHFVPLMMAFSDRVLEMRGRGALATEGRRRGRGPGGRSGESGSGKVMEEGSGSGKGMEGRNWSGKGTEEVVQYVNPFIGTANSGNTNPGAVMPWGMVSISPFNSYDSVAGSSGASPYYHGNKYISGFTHLNMSGVGCGDLGTFCLMPTTGRVNFTRPYAGSEYSEEQASPGYYSVLLDRYHIKAELTTTMRSSISCFSFPKGRSNILLNLGLGLTSKKGGMVKRVSDTEVEGFKNIGNICGLTTIQTVYFVARVSKKPFESGVWGDGAGYDHFQREVAGNEAGAFFSFDTREGEKIYVTMAVSYVSIGNARKNLDAEQNGFDFEGTRRVAERAWNKALSTIRVEGGAEDDKVKFYTALYHALLHPNVFNDANGEYRLFENAGKSQIHGTDRYTVFSLWDTYRCLHPFLSLVYPGKESAMVRSLLGMASESGWLPRWEYAGIESGAMTGDPALPVIADTWLRGIRDFDIGRAYGAMKHNASTPEKDNYMRPGMDNWLKYGYIPEDAANILHPFGVAGGGVGAAGGAGVVGAGADTAAAGAGTAAAVTAAGATVAVTAAGRGAGATDTKNDYADMRSLRIVWGPVSTGLEYGMADWCLAELAKALGKKDDDLVFHRRSQLYRNSFDTSLGFMRPRWSNGDWVRPFDPATHQNDAFTEGSSWNYSFMVPYDMPGLIRLMGGEERFVEKLSTCFDKGYFDITNEPDLAYPYLFNYVKGQEWRTQREVHKIIASSFTNAPDGLPGNDDCGTLSTWLVFSMMGFYPDCPGNMNYQLSGPVFSKITITLDPAYYPGKTFVITNRHGEGYPIRSMLYNGKPYTNFTIRHQDIVKGGTLEFK